MTEYTLTEATKVHMYATHLPLLAACVARTSGPVMELGSGMYSTPVLHGQCVPIGRDLVTIDDNAEWLKHSRQYESKSGGLHQVCLVRNGGWPQTPIESPRAWGIDADRWAVVLVDQTPIKARAVCVARLRGHADLIVCHDSEHRLYGYEPVLEPFAHRVERRRGAPWTTVVSDTMELGWLESLL